MRQGSWFADGAELKSPESLEGTRTNQLPRRSQVKGRIDLSDAFGEEVLEDGTVAWGGGDAASHGQKIARAARGG